MRSSVACALVFATVAALPAYSQSMDRAMQHRIVARAATELEQGYVFPDLGAAMAREVRARVAAGDYDQPRDAETFASTLTNHLQSVSHDKHLRIGSRVSTAASGEGGPRPTPRQPIEGVTVLEGNIGFLAVNGFPPPQAIIPKLDEAMSKLVETDAIIVDLRENRGGTPEGAMYLAGFFTPQTTLVATIYSRMTDATTEMRTADVKGPRYLNRPIYILTSQRTFSAGEAAAYHLKHVVKAITVGESTGGGAHRIRGVELGDGFLMSLPFTRPISVVTRTDWEGTGVIPDIATVPELALNAAHLAALKALPRTAERDSVIGKLATP